MFFLKIHTYIYVCVYIYTYGWPLSIWPPTKLPLCAGGRQIGRTHCKSLQHTRNKLLLLPARLPNTVFATHTLQHTATHCNTLQHTAIHLFSSSQHTSSRQCTYTYINISTHTHTNIQICIYIDATHHIFAYIHTHIQAHIHTQVHTFTQSIQSRADFSEFPPDTPLYQTVTLRKSYAISQKSALTTFNSVN